MRKGIAVATAVAVALLGAAACGSDEEPAGSSDPLDGKGKTLKVWLMVDAQSAWPEVVEAANAKFKDDHQGATSRSSTSSGPTT